MTKLSHLASPSATRAVLNKFDLMTKKALGQHFLVNDDIVRRICELACLSPADTVVEVGPGIGTLSIALLQYARYVIAIERDADLPVVLKETCSEYHDKFEVIHKDALDIDLKDFSFSPNKLVSNLPYAVAATIVLDYFERFSSIESATVMVQAEVADRMCASVGSKNYGAYTVKLSLFAHTHDKFSVSEGNFFPPPRVKSTVIRLDRNQTEIPQDLINATVIMADAAFENRRKNIFNSMKTYFSRQKDDASLKLKILNPHEIESLLNQASISNTVRGESLSRDQFLNLGKAYLEISN